MLMMREKEKIKQFLKLFNENWGTSATYTHNTQNTVVYNWHLDNVQVPKQDDPKKSL